MNQYLVAATAVFGIFAGSAWAQSATYKIDPNHTRTIWETKHFGISTSRGQWEKTDGEITLDRAGKTGRADIVLDMNSIHTGVAPFNNHMKSPDFFDTANHPTARFVSDRFKFEGDKVTEVAGNLTIRGKTQPAVLKATLFNCFDHPSLKREVCGADFETIVKRSQFDINWGLANRAAADDIKVTIQVEAIKQ